jgi:hypothetical protein
MEIFYAVRWRLGGAFSSAQVLGELQAISHPLWTGTSSLDKPGSPARTPTNGREVAHKREIPHNWFVSDAET